MLWMLEYILNIKSWGCTKPEVGTQSSQKRGKIGCRMATPADRRFSFVSICTCQRLCQCHLISQTLPQCFCVTKSLLTVDSTRFSEASVSRTPVLGYNHLTSAVHDQDLPNENDLYGREGHFN